jgi:glyoxylase-like metal-dependent hydrolase (beta-lactamase superfamily II)
MVDAGNSAGHAALFLQSLKELELPTPQYVAITHWHWDHTFAMHAVPGITIAGRLTNEQLSKVMAWDWTEEAMQSRLSSGEEIEFCDTHIRLEYPDLDKITVTTADIVFDQCLVLDLGGITAQFIHIGGPHSEDSVVVYIPEEKILFLGDADGGDFYHMQGLYDKKKLLTFIQFLRDLDFKISIGGHDIPVTKGELLAYMEEELATLS